MTKTVNSNYLSCTSPGSTFNSRISADSDTFARNDIDSLGSALDQHTHASGLGLPVNTIPSGNLGVNVAAVAGISIDVGSNAGAGIRLQGSGVLVGGSPTATSTYAGLTNVFQAPSGGGANNLNAQASGGPTGFAVAAWWKLFDGVTTVYIPCFT